MSEFLSLLAPLAQHEYCYLTTIGRISGRPHEIEIWFGLQGSTLYLMAGNHSSDWVRNLRRTPTVRVRIGGHTFTGTARVVEDPEEDSRTRYMLAEKYQEWEEGRTLSQWARTALPVAIELAPGAS